MRRPLAIALLVAVVASGCGFKHEPTGALAPRFPVSVTDAAGRSITIEHQPRVVLALDPAAVRILKAIGTTPRSLSADSSLSALKAARPDLIVMSPATTPARADSVEHALGVPTYVLAGSALTSIERGAAELGLATGHALAGRDLSLDLRTRRERLERQIANAPVQTVFADTGFGYSISSGDLLAALVKLARGKLVGAGPPQPVSQKRLLNLNPAVYLTERSSHVTLAVLAKRKLTAKLPAVRSGRVLIVDDRLVVPDQDAYTALEKIAHFLHPETSP